ncbi:hypothetical protein [Edaphocola aurantiacus]|uniref:hypothetical protein n=1 Tax=Edaphocola aurantiacus TaxID=2601682 RepID=UPI001C949DE7|nr:hypothetical protein [Edaphocola aurantiacus]
MNSSFKFRLLVIFCLTGLPLSAVAQDAAPEKVSQYTTKDFPRIYINAGISPLNSYIFSTRIRNAGNFLLQPNVSFNFDYMEYGIALEYRLKMRTAKHMPADFQPGDNLFTNDDIYPTDHIDEWNIYLKRNFYTNSGKMYFSAQLGLNIATVSNAAHFQPQPTSSGSWLTIFRDDNYSYDTLKQNAVGLALKAGLVFPFRKGFGISTYLSGNVNKYNSYLGLDINMMFGYVRK